MKMKTPTRPGKMVGNMIKELDLSVTAAAQYLGVTRQTLNNLINNDNASISPEMAIRLEAVFGSSAGNWLRMQANYDEALVRDHSQDIVRGLRKYVQVVRLDNT